MLMTYISCPENENVPGSGKNPSLGHSNSGAAVVVTGVVDVEVLLLVVAAIFTFKSFIFEHNF